MVLLSTPICIRSESLDPHFFFSNLNIPKKFFKKIKIPPTGGNRRAGHEVLTNRETYQYLYFITPSCDKKGVLSL